MINFNKTSFQGFTLSENDITNALATGLSFRNLIRLLKNKTGYAEVGKSTREKIHLIGKYELGVDVKAFIEVLCLK